MYWVWGLGFSAPYLLLPAYFHNTQPLIAPPRIQHILVTEHVKVQTAVLCHSPLEVPTHMHTTSPSPCLPPPSGRVFAVQDPCVNADDHDGRSPAVARCIAGSRAAPSYGCCCCGCMACCCPVRDHVTSAHKGPRYRVQALVLLLTWPVLVCSPPLEPSSPQISFVPQSTPCPAGRPSVQAAADQQRHGWPPAPAPRAGCQ